MDLLRAEVELLHEAADESVAGAVAWELVSQPHLPCRELRLRIALRNTNGNERIFAAEWLRAGREQNRAQPPRYFDCIVGQLAKRLTVRMTRLAASSSACVETVQIVSARKQH
jgi:hypothetical protein